MKIAGIVLIVIGALMLAYQGFTYTTKEKVIDAGPLEVEAEREKTVPLPPVLGAVALAGGIVMLVVSGKT